MNETLNKINEMINNTKELLNEFEKNERLEVELRTLLIVREIIQAEQKEPCEYCQEDRYDELVFASNLENIETYCGVWIDHDKLHQKLVVEDYETIEEEIKINFCPMCGRPLNQKAEEE